MIPSTLILSSHLAPLKVRRQRERDRGVFFCEAIKAFFKERSKRSASSPDSPGVPPSAGAHQLFRGFSFIASTLLEEEGSEEQAKPQPHPVVQVRAQVRLRCSRGQRSSTETSVSIATAREEPAVQRWLRAEGRHRHGLLLRLQTLHPQSHQHRIRRQGMNASGTEGCLRMEKVKAGVTTSPFGLDR